MAPFETSFSGEDGVPERNVATDRYGGLASAPRRADLKPEIMKP